MLYKKKIFKTDLFIGKDMKIGINLLSIRPGKIGGGESFIRNLLDGFLNINDLQVEYFLLVPRNHIKFWCKYNNKSKFHIVSCALNNNNAITRIFYETIFLNRILKKNNITLLFNPVYLKSIIGKPIVPCISVIHDLQALHYPGYFSKIKLIWLKYIWKHTIKISTKIVTTSNFVKNDILENFNIGESKIKVIYIPVIFKERYENFNKIAQKYKLKKQDYYYTVSSMTPHKNLITLLKVIKKLKEKKLHFPQRLVVSGVGCGSRYNKELLKIAEDFKISENIIITGFISDIERNTLYKNAAVFLFPSIFEGFGMPPIEALIKGVPVVTTKKTSIPEVTKNKAIYVDDPFNVDEWISKIKYAINSNRRAIIFNDYDIKKIANEYLNLFNNIYKGKKIGDKEDRYIV